MLVLRSKGFMKCVVEMGSGVMIHIPSFINICSAIQKIIVAMHTQTVG
jgi:hypothetical protein